LSGDWQLLWIVQDFELCDSKLVFYTVTLEKVFLDNPKNIVSFAMISTVTYNWVMTEVSKIGFLLKYFDETKFCLIHYIIVITVSVLWGHSAWIIV